MPTPSKRMSTPLKSKPNLDNSSSPPQKKAVIISNIQICPPSSAPKDIALAEIQEQVQKYKDAEPAQVNILPDIDLTMEEADEEADTEADTEVATFKADTTKTDEDKENLQDPDDIDSVMETDDAQTIPCPSSLMEKSDGQIMPNPNSFPTRDQILPKSLFIPNPDDPVSLMEKAADVTGKDTFTAAFTVSGGILIQPKSIETHEILVKHFQDLNLYSESNKQPKFKAIIDGIFHTVSTNWITDKINELGFNVFHIENIIGNISGFPTKKWRLELHPSPININILTITKIGQFIVRITEPAPPKPIKQCFKCQKFGHTQYECKQPYTTCSKCAGNHYYKSCTKSRSLPGKCINCGGNHVANHGGCVYMKKALNDLPTNAPARRAEQSLAALNWTEDPAFKGTLQNMMNPPPVRAPFFPTPNFLPNQIDMLRAQYRPMQRQIYQPAQSRDQPFALPPPPNYEY
ncbi:hypothetical protein ACLKA7_005287 [Drosophila subpalustris]